MGGKGMIREGERKERQGKKEREIEEEEHRS